MKGNVLHNDTELFRFCQHLCCLFFPTSTLPALNVNTKKPCFSVWSRSFGAGWSYQKVRHFTPAEDWPRLFSSWSTCWCFCRRRRPPPVLSGSRWRAWSGTHSPPGLRCTACWCAGRFPSCRLQAHKDRLMWAHPPPACTLSTRLLCHYNAKDLKLPKVFTWSRHVEMMRMITILWNRSEDHKPTYKGPLILSCRIFPGDLPVFAP